MVLCFALRFKRQGFAVALHLRNPTPKILSYYPSIFMKPNGKAPQTRSWDCSAFSLRFCFFINVGVYDLVLYKIMGEHCEGCKGDRKALAGHLAA